MSGTRSSDDLLRAAYTSLRRSISALPPGSVLPSSSAITAAERSLPDPSSADYMKPRYADATIDHIHSTIVPALTGQNLSGRYYGFVTGSTLPVAEAADNVVSALDANVQVHLPTQTICTTLEDSALRMVCSLLEMNPDVFRGRTFTTGATASNVLGLTVGRESLLEQAWGGEERVNTHGLLHMCQLAKVSEIQVLTSTPHSSIAKAASIAGFGRANVHILGLSNEEPWRLDVDAVEKHLDRKGVLSIIVVSAGEVNTGAFSTDGDDMQRLRKLADQYKAWIHVDGAFGLFARTLPKTSEFARLREGVECLELADSITADGHKLLNVPYDCGIFLCRHPDLQQAVFRNQASYLTSSSDQIPSPLNVGIENSRRFRALPVYAALLSEGRQGMERMFTRMVRFARKVAEFIKESDPYELLPSPERDLASVHIVVLFRAKDEKLNGELVERINVSKEMYVSGTQWEGQVATRLAVSSYRVNIEEDLAVVKRVLGQVASDSSS